MKWLCSILLVLCMLHSLAQAQNSAALEGTVTDKDGVPVPGATVILIGTSRGAATDVSGEYRIVGLKPGIYRVVVTSFPIDHSDTLIREIALSSDTVIKVHFQFDEVEDHNPDDVAPLRVKRIEAGVTGGHVREITTEDLLNSNPRDCGVLVGKETVKLTDSSYCSDTIASGVQVHNSSGRKWGSRPTETTIRRDGFEITDPFSDCGGFAFHNPRTATAIYFQQIEPSGFEAEYGDIIGEPFGHDPSEIYRSKPEPMVITDVASQLIVEGALWLRTLSQEL